MLLLGSERLRGVSVIGSNRHFRTAVIRPIAMMLMVTAIGTPSYGQTGRSTLTENAWPLPAAIPSGMTEADRTRATILSFSYCIVLSHRKAVEKILAMPPLDKAYARSLADLASSDCLQEGRLTMSEPLMRGGLYAALYRVDYGRTEAGIASQPLSFAADVGSSKTPDAQQYVGLHEFADCVVRADPADARKLVLSAVATASERGAFTGLAPNFNACLFNGQKLEFSRIILLSLLAEDLYREAKSSSPQAAAGL